MALDLIQLQGAIIPLIEIAFKSTFVLMNYVIAEDRSEYCKARGAFQRDKGTLNSYFCATRGNEELQTIITVTNSLTKLIARALNL